MIRQRLKLPIFDSNGLFDPEQVLSILEQSKGIMFRDECISCVQQSYSNGKLFALPVKKSRRQTYVPKLRAVVEQTDIEFQVGLIAACPVTRNQEFAREILHCV